MILQLIKERRSVRRFAPGPPSDESLMKLIEAAAAAPSAGNKQPWRFIIVKTRALIESAVHAVNEERARLLTLLRGEFRADFERYSENFTNFRRAPVLIVPVYRSFAGLSEMLQESAGEEERLFQRSLERHASLVAVSSAIQNILLMARGLGLGACCMTGPLIAENALVDCFKVPSGWRIAAVIAVGRPDEQPVNPGRKPLKSIIKWR
ncbi:MAG: nitroreductase family protein [Desulfobacterales bacterium]|nr:nitroreductase family protein [Desulfobacterales bacterium]